MVTDVCHEFSFLSRIIELILSITRSVAEGHGTFLFYHELSNYRIFFTRSVAEDHGFFFTLNVGSAEVWVTRSGGVGACFCM